MKIAVPATIAIGLTVRGRVMLDLILESEPDGTIGSIISSALESLAKEKSIDADLIAGRMALVIADYEASLQGK